MFHAVAFAVAVFVVAVFMAAGMAAAAAMFFGVAAFVAVEEMAHPAGQVVAA